MRLKTGVMMLKISFASQEYVLFLNILKYKSAVVKIVIL